MTSLFTPIFRPLLGSLLVGVWLLVGMATPLHASATAHLQQAVQNAIVILNDPALNSPERAVERREKLRQVIYAEFDFKTISQSAVGQPWRKFSEAQKTRFIPLFKRLLENTYIGTIERYKGEDVRFFKEVEQSSTMVRADSVVKSKGTEYKISYLLRQQGALEWKVVDVIIEGVSVISNYRSQFKRMLRRGTPEEIEGLLGQLETSSKQ